MPYDPVATGPKVVPYPRQDSEGPRLRKLRDLIDEVRMAPYFQDGDAGTLPSAGNPDAIAEGAGRTASGYEPHMLPKPDRMPANRFGTGETSGYPTDYPFDRAKMAIEEDANPPPMRLGPPLPARPASPAPAPPAGALVLPDPAPAKNTSGTNGPSARAGRRVAAEGSRAAQAAREAQGARQDAQRGARDSQRAGRAAAAKDAGAEAAKRAGRFADPEETRAEAGMSAQSAIDANARPTATDDFSERSETAAVANETSDFNEQMRDYEQLHRAWSVRYNNALAKDDDATVASIAAQEPKPPRPSLRMTGGKDLEEIDTPVGDTFAALESEEQAALATHLDGLPGGLDENLSNLFGDIPAEERLPAMRQAAENARRGAIGKPKDPVQYKDGSEGGSVGTLADGGASQPGLPASVGDNAENVSPEEAQMASRDVVHGFPRTQKGGTAIRNPDGSTSSRAAGSGMAGALRDAKIETDPDVITPEWRGHMKAYAIESGVDPTRMTDDGLVAAGQKLYREDSARIDKGMKIKPVVSGGYRWSPSPEQRRQQGVTSARGMARDMKRLYPIAADGTDTHLAEIDQAAEAGNLDELRRIQRGLRNGRFNETAKATRDNLRQRGETQNMRNPNVAPAMLRASLDQAGPGGQAQVLRQFGQFDEADRVAGRENEASAIRAADARAKAEFAASTAEAARREKPKDPLASDVYLQQVNSHTAGAIAEPQNVTNLATSQQMVEQQRDKNAPPYAGAVAVARGVIGHPAGGPNHPAVMLAINQIWQTVSKGWYLTAGYEQSAFYDIVERQLGPAGRTLAENFVRNKGGGSAVASK